MHAAQTFAVRDPGTDLIKSWFLRVICYGRAQFQGHAGLYVVSQVGQEIKSDDTFRCVPVPRSLLLMLIFSLTILFLSFGLFGPRNATVTVGLLTSALAVCGAIFLILEMYHPDYRITQGL
jgi:hypothetical protein